MVCFPRANIDAVGSGKGGYMFVHVGTNNAEREGTAAIVRKHRQLDKGCKQLRFEQIIMSGILHVMGSREQGY